MLKSTFTNFALFLALAHIALAGAPTLAQAQGKTAGKIVCWKDKSGKVVGCGDTVPPEYRSSATDVLDKRGVLRDTTESAEAAAKRQAQERAAAEQKAAEEKRAADQRRRDSALLATYANEQEIDMKRDRESKVIENQISQSQAALKSVESQLSDAKSRKSDSDAARASASIDKLQKDITAKEKEREALLESYAAQKKRYQELRGTSQSATAPAKK